MTELQVDAALGVALLTDMLRVRRMEEKCAELYGASKIRGFLHLYIGEEAVAVGVMAALEPDDAIVATYRGRIPVNHADLYRIGDEDELVAGVAAEAQHARDRTDARERLVEIDHEARILELRDPLVRGVGRILRGGAIPGRRRVERLEPQRDMHAVEAWRGEAQIEPGKPR